MTPRLRLILTCVFLLLVTLYADRAWADILFLDLNDAPDEVAAAQSAADQRLEKLIVIPSRTDAQTVILRQVHNLEMEKNDLSTTATAYWRVANQAQIEQDAEKSKKNFSQAKIDLLQKKIDLNSHLQYQEFEKIKAPLAAIKAQEAALHPPHFSMTELQSVIDDHQKNGKEIESLIVSGHHGGLQFTGVLVGSIDQNQLVAAFAKDPDVYHGIKEVYAWGCYSATVAASGWWKGAFPSEEFVAGYNYGSPSEERTPDLVYLTGSLLHAAKIRTAEETLATDKKVAAIVKMAHEIPDFDLAGGALCTRSVCVGYNRVTDLTDIKKAACTLTELSALQAGQQRYQAIVNSQVDGTENISCDTSNPNPKINPLRAYYNSVREHEDCGNGTTPNPLQEDFRKIVANNDNVIRLIDFGQVYKNFYNYYKEAKLDSSGRTGTDRPTWDSLAPVLEKCGNPLPDLNGQIQCVPPPAQDLRGLTLTRHDVLASALQLTCTNHNVSEEDLAAIQRMRNRFDNMLTNLNCIPLSWVNETYPGTDVEAPDPKCADTDR